MSNIPEGAAMTPQKILLIDDDPSVTRLLKAKLESLGITTEATNEPDQAPGLVRRFKPDLIVCDIDMGDAAGGGEVAQELDGDWRTAGIPIVFLSSMVMPEDMGHKQGGRKLISKQISMAAILERIVAELPPRK